VARDIDELQRIARSPRSCELDANCPAGSHCDGDRGQCAWECLSDSDCGDQDLVCTGSGACEQRIGPVLLSPADSPACQAVPFEERRAVLESLDEDQRFCAGDEDCPCGAYCASDALCLAECIAELPDHPDMFCDPGRTCTPLGRCQEAGEEPAPPLELTLEIRPTVLVADTQGGPVLVQAQVVVVATSLDVLDPTHPAQVFIGFAERGDPEPAVMPRVKCAAQAALADSCEFDGGWIFNVSSGSLRSDPRTVWVEIPQIAGEQQWTLEARSEWADIPATTVVRAATPSFPASEVGDYTGTLTWPQENGSSLTLDVRATVTTTHMVLFEDTSILVPHGHVVLSRDLSRSTLVEWLRSDDPNEPPPHLTIRMDLDALAYQSSTGRLSGTITVRAHAPKPATLSLARSGEISAPSCSGPASCSIGSYCNADVGLCVPGAATPDAIRPDSVWMLNRLKSAQLRAWWVKLDALVDQDPRFRGTDVIGIERAYCNRTPSQSEPATFGHNTAEPARDLVCADGTSDGLAQKTFAYANLTTEVVEDSQGVETFNLLDSCLDDLNVQPTGPNTAANLLPDNRECVSLGRFFLSLLANDGISPVPEAAGRLVGHIMRQWLALNAFVARTTIQEQDYDDVLGSSGAPASERLGAAVDLMERAWRIFIEVRQQLITEPAADQTEYRLVNRPVAHWTFNGVSGGVAQDSESDFDLSMSGNMTTGALVLVGSSGTCLSQDPIRLPDDGFTVMGWVGARIDGRFTLFQKLNFTDPLRIDIEWNRASPANVKVFVVGPAGRVEFTLPAVSGYYAFVKEGLKYRIYRMSSAIQEYAPTALVDTEPGWGAEGVVLLNCNAANGTDEALAFDEVSLWPRPLSREALLAMSRSYFEGDSPQFDQVGLPPRGLGGIQIAGTDQQATGVPVQILDAASATADLLASYVDAERSAMYDACYQGGSAPLSTAMTGRVGRALRFIYLAEDRAAKLMPGAAPPWLASYQARKTELEAKRRKVVDALRTAASCINPLGITEDDLPLFHGQTVGASERFFASSRYLVARAKEQITAAGNKLEQARTGYHDQRLSAFQVTMGSTEKAERLRKLKLEYEAALKRLCGPRAGGQPLLPSFFDGTLTASTCLFKVELPTCQNLQNTPIERVPAQCLRGELGEHVLAIHAAGIDAENARRDYDRALDRYAAAGEYCARRQAHHEESDQILTEHLRHVQHLRTERRAAAMMGGFLKNMVGMVVGAAVGSAEMAIGSWLDSVGMVAGQPEQQLAEAEQRAHEQYQIVVQQRSAELDLMECFHEADNQKFAIDAARDIIERAQQDVTLALFRLGAARDEVTALVAEAVGQIAVEESIDRTPPHHHFWLADHIDEYHRHLRHARRLTYLALRALEYESQQSLGLRGPILTARRPDHLDQVIDEIEARHQPMYQEDGFNIGERPVVLSLRDEIMRIEDLASSSSRGPGDPLLTAEEAFRVVLRSPSARIYDRNAQYLGQGIHFELLPGAWVETSCAERTWQVTASVQMDGTIVNNAVLVLNQENAFASQDCHSETRGELHVARIRPHHNLLIGETSPNFTEPSQYSEMNVEAHMNESRESLRNRPEGQHGGFAGRGLYGKHVLLFPKGKFPDAVLANVKDVLIRFDLVEVTNVDL
jgi:hypothetical protein